MILTFLGTAASEGYPDAFCGCENCGAARALGGPSLRKRSSALLDDVLLIDLGPDVMAAALMHGVQLDRLRYCLQTHEHHDHLDPSHLLSRSPYSGVRTAPLLEWFAAAPALERAAASLASHRSRGALTDPEVADRLNMRAHAIVAGQTFAAGSYRVLAVPAAHDHDSLLFLIERAGRRLFYATDTGPLPEAAWELLAAAGGPIHLVAMDHTFGMRDRSTGHLNADQFCEQVERMRGMGLLAPGARIFAHHLGHHSNPPHPELAAYAAARGYEPAYDGLRVTV